MKLGVESGEVFVSAGARRSRFAAGGRVQRRGPPRGRRAGGRDPARRDDLRPRAGRRAGGEARATRLEGAQREGPGLASARARRPRTWRCSVRPRARSSGASRELAELRDAFARARDERRCRAVTVAGPAGFGQVAARARADHRDRRRRHGRRRPLPLIRGGRDVPPAGRDRRPARRSRSAAADHRASRRGRAECGDGADRDRHVGRNGPAPRRPSGPSAGCSSAWPGSARSSWSSRTSIGRDRPCWTCSSTSSRSRASTPILLVCLARPELLDTRPDGPRRSRTDRCWCWTRSRRPTPAGWSRTPPPASSARARLRGSSETADGNPLFLEQLVAMGAESEEATLPSSIQAVLAARIDRLDPGERALLEHASVQGRSFYVGAVEDVLAERDRAGTATRLVSLVRKQLIRCGAVRPSQARTPSASHTC